MVLILLETMLLYLPTRTSTCICPRYLKKQHVAGGALTAAQLITVLTVHSPVFQILVRSDTTHSAFKPKT